MDISGSGLRWFDDLSGNISCGQANASDKELVEWTKGKSAVQFDGEPCSFPGQIWKSA